MKITRIVQQAKRRDRYSIFVDGRYTFSLGESALLASGLAAGQELSAGALAEWKRESADDRLYGAALRYAAMRFRSRWELEQYLHRKGASPALSSTILNKLSNIGLLDDAKFAQAFIANRALLRPTSKRKLQQELRAKHIADELIGQALHHNDQTVDDRAALRAVIAKKRRAARYAHDDAKLMQYLARQGFAYQDIQLALSSVVDDR